MPDRRLGRRAEPLARRGAPAYWLQSRFTPPGGSAFRRSALALLLALLALAGCTGISAIRLPGGPGRGTMTYDDAMGARSGLTTVDRVPPAER